MNGKRTTTTISPLPNFDTLEEEAKSTYTDISENDHRYGAKGLINTTVSCPCDCRPGPDGMSAQPTRHESFSVLTSMLIRSGLTLNYDMQVIAAENHASTDSYLLNALTAPVAITVRIEGGYLPLSDSGLMLSVASRNQK